MAVIVEIVSSLAIELGKYIVTPIKHQFNYLCCFNNNIQKLREDAKKLNDARDMLQHQVDTARRNTEVIFPEVETWITKAKKIQVNISGIEIDVPKVQGNRLNVKSRFSLSKKAKKTTKSMKKLQDSCMFRTISLPSSPASVKFTPFGQAYEFETRKRIEEDIMSTLRDNKVTMVGICGMGGVGKTTMAKRIMNQAKEENLYDEVVMVVVTKQVDMLKIQHEIAELLGLKFEVESLSARAHKLHGRLMGTKGILMVLDDVWSTLKLEDLGIPCEKCTVLFTSQDKGVLDTMDVQKICALQILSKKEAWFLFNEKVGPCVNDLNLLSIARDIVEECNGLPIALVTVGRALKDKKNVSVWKDALLQLRSGNPVDMPDVITRVYKPLKLSYDSLDSQSARSLFLLCSLFPEDHNIPLEYLTFYGMGLSMFDGIKHLEEARNRVCTLIEMLKSRFLLLDGRDERHVRMHDVVRDVAIFTASREGRVNLESIDWSVEHSDCTWISVTSKKENDFNNPMRLIFRSLRLLRIDNSEEIDLEMDDYFFEGMKWLNVLFMKSIWSKSLPQTIQLLKELRTLHLDSCTIDNISFVGELSNLEILSCRSCHWIEELPVEMGNLDKLRLLEFSDCTSLKTIKPGIISRLVHLEELKIRGSFKRWEADEKGREKRNISLKELQFLSNLTCLEIEITDCSLAAEKIYLSPKIAKYDVRIYGKWPKNISTDEKRVFLELRREITLGSWIHQFVKSTEFLDLTGDGSNSLNLTEVQMVKSFGLSDCSTVKKLVNAASVVFPFLESLWLCRVHNLEEICDGTIPVGSTSFGNLKDLTLDCLPALVRLWKSPNQNVLLGNLSFIHIWTCNNLRNLFSSTMARGLSQLEEMDIRSCEKMEEIFLNENEDDPKNRLMFPKLKRVSLGDLPRLASFCRGIERIEFPRLTYVEIQKCPKLTSLACNGDSGCHGGDDCFHLFCNQKVAFGNLKELYIHSYENVKSIWCREIPMSFFSGLEKLVINSCDNIKSLFSSSAAENLVNLKELTIRSCNEMVKVIEDEENVCEKSPLPCLELLELSGLLNLVSLCEWSCDLELPSLRHVSIDECPQMKSLTLGLLRASNLGSIKINGEVMSMEDSNGVVMFKFGANEYEHICLV